MASESSDEGVSLSLPADLSEWVDRKAADLGVDRETVVVQLLASYRAIEELDGEVDAEGALTSDDAIEERVRDVIAERIPDIAAAVGDRIDDADGAADVEERLTTELDRMESEFTEKVQDVRERVIQVKREADARAPADHDHEAIGDLGTAVSDLEERVDDLDEQLATQTDRLDATGDDVDALAERVDAVEGAVDRLDDIEERVRTVAWVVSDLRDAQEAQTVGTEAIDRLKRTAAQLDVDRAVCENCSTAVEIALLSTPTCPHCEVALSDVEPASGIFGKPQLTVAKQLEAGDGTDRDNVPDAADQRGRR